MQRPRSTLVVACLFAITVVCRAQAQSQCDSPEYESQAKQNFCSGERYRAEDRKLNTLYKRLMARLPPQERERLREEQRAWLSNLEPGCKEPLGPREQAGSMWAMEFYDCMAQETAARVKVLAQWPAKR